MDKHDQIATAALALVALATAVVMMAVPFVFHVTPNVGWWLFWGGVCAGAVALLVGFIALFRRRDSLGFQAIDESVTSRGQSGGITARNINFEND